MKQSTKYKTKSVHLVDNPAQAAMEHFPETSPPLLGYLWLLSSLTAATDTLQRIRGRSELAPALSEIL